MEKHFANYKISQALKALGFDEPCFGYYEFGTYIFWYGSVQESELPLNCTAPTMQQTITFLETLGYYITLKPDNSTTGDILWKYDLDFYSKAFGLSEIIHNYMCPETMFDKQKTLEQAIWVVIKMIKEEYNENNN